MVSYFAFQQFWIYVTDGVLRHFNAPLLSVTDMTPFYCKRSNDKSIALSHTGEKYKQRAQ